MDIGIIGGADGPTTIFVSSDTGSYQTAIKIIVSIAVIGAIIWTIRKGKRKR